MAHIIIKTVLDIDREASRRPHLLVAIVNSLDCIQEHPVLLLRGNCYKMTSAYLKEMLLYALLLISSSWQHPESDYCNVAVSPVSNLLVTTPKAELALH